MSDISPHSSRDPRATKLCVPGHLFRDRYEVVRTLGRGGFGVTHLARDRMLPGSPFCVIKQLFPKVSHPVALERAKQRFRREARILGRLGSHSQLPMLLDYFTFKGEFFLVQEYIRGSTLSREVRKNGTYKETQIYQFLHSILPVVEYIHSNRVIHRDIKPPNIIRCRDDNRLVLIDFGAVRECLQDDDFGDQQPGPTTHFVGTMGFAPPEQLALRPTYSSDIYALGITCLYLLTGKSPAEFKVDTGTQQLHWQDSVQVHPSLKRILEKMLTVNVSERYRRIDDLRRALELTAHHSSLEQCLNTPNKPAAEPEPSTPTEQTRVTPSQRRAAAIRRWRQRQKQHSSSDMGRAFPL